MKKQNAKQQGFTLVETLIAMLVMMIAGLGSAGLFVVAVKHNSGATDRAMAVAVAQDQLEKLRNLPFVHSELTATPTAGSVSSVKQGSANANQGRQFQVKKIVTDEVLNGVTSAKVITIEVTPTNGQRWSRGPVRVTARRTSTTVGPYL